MDVRLILARTATIVTLLCLNACSGGGASPSVSNASGVTSAMDSTLSLQGTKAASQQIPPFVSQSPKTSSAAAFIDTVGIDSHFNHRQLAEYVHFSTVSAALIQSGIHHLRDGTTTPDPTYLSQMNFLGSHGITHSIGVPFGTTAAVIAAQLQKQAPYIDSIEVSNEVDASGQNWINQTRQAQSMVYKVVKSSASAGQVTVLAPSLSRAGNSLLLGAVPADAANLHNATCNLLPETTTSAGMLSNVTAISPEAPGKPVWTTETGYDNDPSSVCYITPSSAAVYVPRTVTARWKMGSPRTEFDMLSDNPGASSFAYMGMFDSNGNPKPQFTALASLTSLLSDPGSSFRPTQLPLTVGANSSNLQSILLEKRNGTYYLLLWQAVPSYDPFTRSAITVAPITATITLPHAPQFAELEAYNTSTWQLHWNRVKIGATMQVPVSDKVAVLEITP